MTILANIFGVLGICSATIIYQQKNRKHLLICKLITDLLWFFHYLFLGAYSGAAIAAIGACRDVVFVNRSKRWAKSMLWLPLFIAVSIVCNVLTWKNAFSLFTLIASCLSIISFFIGKPKLSRILAFPISACMLTYDIANNSVAGITNEIFTIISSLVGLLIIDRKRRTSSISE